MYTISFIVPHQLIEADVRSQGIILTYTNSMSIGFIQSTQIRIDKKVIIEVNTFSNVVCAKSDIVSGQMS